MDCFATSVADLRRCRALTTFRCFHIPDASEGSFSGFLQARKKPNKVEIECAQRLGARHSRSALGISTKQNVSGAPGIGAGNAGPPRHPQAPKRECFGMLDVGVGSIGHIDGAECLGSARAAWKTKAAETSRNTMPAAMRTWKKRLGKRRPLCPRLANLGQLPVIGLFRSRRHRSPAGSRDLPDFQGDEGKRSKETAEGVVRHSTLAFALPLPKRLGKAVFQV